MKKKLSVYYSHSQMKLKQAQPSPEHVSKQYNFRGKTGTTSIDRMTFQHSRWFVLDIGSFLTFNSEPFNRFYLNRTSKRLKDLWQRGSTSRGRVDVWVEQQFLVMPCLPVADNCKYNTQPSETFNSNAIKYFCTLKYQILLQDLKQVFIKVLKHFLFY